MEEDPGDGGGTDGRGNPLACLHDPGCGTAIGYRHIAQRQRRGKAIIQFMAPTEIERPVRDGVSLRR